MRKTRSNQFGFTLVELMIVVAIIGILAVVAIPTYLRFTRQSKTAEVGISFGIMTRSATIWYNTEHTNTTDGNPLPLHFPHNKPNVGDMTGSDEDTQFSATMKWGVEGSKHASQPTNAPCLYGSSQYSRNASMWLSVVWTRLQFNIDKAHYFQYAYATSGTASVASYIVAARADLDCDATYSDYRLRGYISPSTGELQHSNITKRDPLE